MIDLALLRKEPDQTKQLIHKKEPSFDVDRLIELDKEARALTNKVETLRKKKNELAKKAGKGGISEEVRAESIELGKALKQEEQSLTAIKESLKALALSCPNLLLEVVPEGGKEQNQVITTVGTKQDFSFTPKNHLELNEQHQWFDFRTATTMSGSHFVLYKSEGVKLLYALTSLMLKNNVKYGFEPVLPPFLVNEASLINSGNLPKFKGDFYEMPADDLSLIPTAEVNLTNIHANQIIDQAELPKRYTAWTSCFRREAGSYGAEERGLIRIHQFEKVELYTITTPEESDQELERMLSCAQDLLQQLGLHYQISLLAAQDCSFSSAKTYDIEVWLPGQQSFYEVSSCSNCTDFQARRAKIRYRSSADDKPHLAHTLNGSSLALPRLIVALIEQYQQEDGGIVFPEALQKAIDNVW